MIFQVQLLVCLWLFHNTGPAGQEVHFPEQQPDSPVHQEILVQDCETGLMLTVSAAKLSLNSHHWGGPSPSAVPTGDRLGSSNTQVFLQLLSQPRKEYNRGVKEWSVLRNSMFRWTWFCFLHISGVVSNWIVIHFCVSLFQCQSEALKLNNRRTCRKPQWNFLFNEMQ